MKSNSERWALAAGLLVFALSFAAVSALRPTLQQQFREATRREDSQLLPPAELAVVMSFGYRSALADLLFAHVLVSYGQHFLEKRRFDTVEHYLDSITVLDPKFREPYRLADTLLTVQPRSTGLSGLRAAKRIQERGLREFPYDSELWLIAGQFHAYLAANLVPAAERAAWREDGAKKLARSCELIGSNENIPHHCITAALLFNQAGQRDAMRSFLERVMAVSDDAEIQDMASGYLGLVLGNAERERAEERGKRFRALWAQDLTFISRDLLLLLAPRFDAARCAGLAAHATPSCVTSFRAWSEMIESR